MRILISGGGLAGLTAAFWLRRNGHEPIVIEHSPGLRRDGYGLDFFGVGYDVAERMGIIDELSRKQIFLDRDGAIAFVDSDGSVKAKLKVDSVRKVLGGRYLGQMHANLEEVLYDAVKDNVEVRFGRSITSVTQDSRSVMAVYDNDESESFDLLVGADGIHSNVRRLAFGPEKQYADYMGYYLACYFIPDSGLLNAVWENYVEPGRQVGAYHTDREGQLATLFLWQSEDRGYVPYDERAGLVRASFEGMGWHTQEILDQMPTDGREILVDTVTQIKMDTWRNGRVVLAGDAAGCMTLISGQGASMALASSYVLAEELGRTDDWRRALANYEHRVKPQVELRQGKARDFAKQFVPGTRLGIAVQSVVMKLITYHAFEGLLKSQFVGDSFLRSAALHRLPRSTANVVGYRLSGTLRETDYRTLALDLDETLATSKSISLVLDLDGLSGMSAGAVWNDWKLGRRYADRIRRLAIVGHRRLGKWLSRLAEPFLPGESRHFPTAKRDEAWEWVNRE